MKSTTHPENSISPGAIEPSENAHSQTLPVTSHLEDLPTDIFLRIAWFLEADDLCRLTQCSRTLATNTTNDSAWKELAKSYGVDRCISAREAVRSVQTLHDTCWQEIKPPTQSTVPVEREKFAAFLCNEGKTLLVFGGQTINPNREFFSLDDCWAMDIATAQWTQAAVIPQNGGATFTNAPSPRCFGADCGGGAILVGRDGREWLAIFGGLRAEGFRDNETWLLGPLGEASDAPQWRWIEVQPDGMTQSPNRPRPRFHHSINVVPCHGGGSCMVVLGGHNYMIQPILSAWVLDLGQLGVRTDGTVEETSSVQWHPLPTNPPSLQPPPRAYHTTVVWPAHGLVMFGGEIDSDSHLDDIWLLATNHSTAGNVLDYCHWRWVNLLPKAMTPPPGLARSRASAAIVRGEKLMIFGGSDKTQYNEFGIRSVRACSNIWTLDLQNPSHGGWLLLTARIGVYGPGHLSSTAVAVHGGETVLVLGGHTSLVLDTFGDPIHLSMLRMSDSWAGKVKMPLTAKSKITPSVSWGRMLFFKGEDVHLGQRTIGAVCMWVPSRNYNVNQHGSKQEQQETVYAPVVVALGARSSSSHGGLSGLSTYLLSFTG